ncbi:hypothetical protein HK105_201169 [Polyrhizophydium stewartii]|uniref:Ubiquitin-like domain-containing protein n=1 Tax=Polyrhizophydium stewartii TaxID=2732419 RepID=A0ABR4NJ16_9FUNG
MSLAPRPVQHQRITVSVGTLTGKTFTLSIFTTNTVGELKYRIFEEEGIPVESQLLVFRDKHLTQDEALVGEFGIQSGSRIQLVLHMAGGPGPPIRTRSQIPEQDNVVFLLCKQNDEIFMLEVHMRQGKTPHTAAKHILRIAQGAAGDKVLQCFDSSECFEISDLGDIDLVFDDASDDVDVDTDPDEEFDLDEFDDSMQDRGASYGSDGDEDGLYSGDLDSVFLHNAIYFDSRGSSGLKSEAVSPATLRESKVLLGARAGPTAKYPAGAQASKQDTDSLVNIQA